MPPRGEFVWQPGGGNRIAYHVASDTLFVQGGAMKAVVMIVEDCVELRRGWARWIRRRECDVLEAGTIEEAWAVADGRVIDAWVVDQRLPDGLGTNLVRELRRSGSTAPVLLVTGRPSLRLVNEAAPILAFFHAKPIEREAVDALIDAARKPLELDARIAQELDLGSGEHEVVARRLEGVSRSGIAPALHVSEDAVKSRIRNTLRKASKRGWSHDHLDDLLLDFERSTRRRPVRRRRAKGQ